MRIYKIVGIVLSAILLLASCTNSDLEKKKVKIAYANWLEGIAMSHLAMVVLEEHGYEVELQNADLAPIFVSMSELVQEDSKSIAENTIPTILYILIRILSFPFSSYFFVLPFLV